MLVKIAPTKDYLSFENQRNKLNETLHAKILRRVYGPSCEVLEAHHIVFKTPEMPEPVEIPSADTLLFDHAIQEKVFGHDKALEVMAAIAASPAEDRDELYSNFLADLD